MPCIIDVRFRPGVPRCWVNSCLLLCGDDPVLPIRAYDTNSTLATFTIALLECMLMSACTRGTKDYGHVSDGSTPQQHEPEGQDPGEFPSQPRGYYHSSIHQET